MKRIHRLLTARRFAGEGRRGFTLIELLLVVTITSSLAALAVPNVLAVMEDSRVVEAMSDIRVMAATARDYKLVNGTYPDSFDKFGFKDPLDPWGNLY